MQKIQINKKIKIDFIDESKGIVQDGCVLGIAQSK